MQNNNSDRFARLRLLVKDEGLKRLSESTVMVIGLGGVGSSCAEALARGGVGKLILIDQDTVEASNINRQALAFTSTIGQVKAEVMAKMVHEINPECQVYSEQIALDSDNMASTLSAYPRPDYVIDCIDTVLAKLSLMEWCATEELPLLSAMGAGNKLDPSQLQFAYIEKTFNCLLAKAVRKECRKKGIRGVEVLFSKELPIKVELEDDSVKGRALGTMSYMPPIMGQMLAGKVLRRLLGFETKARNVKFIGR
ncbi:tRNA threonylcarbamoyladenosine dehydratase [Facklamia lactis]|uniref:tRNA threonylcarbamoyladenosine dehydratase n=1 Tax=Facklamia lactis TaxID=2749967 RepID=UPI0018CED3AF|nr:tRNA threonylcarbamoyladenosine dehydratase [Facklamia lactis]MBG9980369.1 tRNA threonylcarbamoyladenosine dehydratase [Facklamia lactis]